jgi:hypothetical protein
MTYSDLIKNQGASVMNSVKVSIAVRNAGGGLQTAASILVEPDEGESRSVGARR